MRGYSFDEKPKLIQMLPPALAAVALAAIGLVVNYMQPSGGTWELLSSVLLWLVVLAISISGLLTIRWVVFNALILIGLARANHYNKLIEFADTIKALNERQMLLMETHDHLTIKMLLKQDSNRLFVEWQLQSPLGKIPLEFVRDFLKSSIRFYPNLLPVSHHDRDKLTKQYPKSEWLVRSITEQLVSIGVAEKIGSNQSARLKEGYTIQLIAEALGLSLD